MRDRLNIIRYVRDHQPEKLRGTKDLHLYVAELRALTAQVDAINEYMFGPSAVFASAEERGAKLREGLNAHSKISELIAKISEFRV